VQCVITQCTASGQAECRLAEAYYVSSGTFNAVHLRPRHTVVSASDLSRCVSAFTLCPVDPLHHCHSHVTVDRWRDHKLYTVTPKRGHHVWLPTSSNAWLGYLFLCILFIFLLKIYENTSRNLAVTVRSFSKLIQIGQTIAEIAIYRFSIWRPSAILNLMTGNFSGW